MPNDKEMYHILFHETTNAISALQKAQQKAEEAYITSATAENLTVISSNTGNGKEKKKRPSQR